MVKIDPFKLKARPAESWVEPLKCSYSGIEGGIEIRRPGPLTQMSSGERASEFMEKYFCEDVEARSILPAINGEAVVVSQSSATVFALIVESQCGEDRYTMEELVHMAGISPEICKQLVDLYHKMLGGDDTEAERPLASTVPQSPSD